MKNKSNYSYPQAIQRAFSQIKSVDNLAYLLETEVYALEFLSQNHSYHEFYVKKKSGGKRLIEDPNDVLKEILRKLNHYLQHSYYVCRSDAAFAFQLSPDNESEPRNILSNAKRHLNHDWLLNIDFLDFFHQVSNQEVFEIFTNEPFNFKDDMALLLASLTTYKGRLPMGSPTSPVLSNFATLKLDKDLLDFVENHQWTFTRFADDLTFSAFSPILENHIREIRDLCTLHNFTINEEKVKLYSPSMTKIVTGLKVSDKVDLTDDYLPMVKNELQKYANVIELNYRTGKHETPWIKTFEQQIEGHLAFIRYIKGQNSEEYQTLFQTYCQAQTQPDGDYDSISWLDMGYWDLIK